MVDEVETHVTTHQVDTGAYCTGAPMNMFVLNEWLDRNVQYVLVTGASG